MIPRVGSIPPTVLLLGAAATWAVFSFGAVEEWAYAPLWLAGLAAGAAVLFKGGLDFSEEGFVLVASFAGLSWFGWMQWLFPQSAVDPMGRLLLTVSQTSTGLAAAAWAAGAGFVICASRIFTRTDARRAFPVVISAVALALALCGAIQKVASPFAIYGLRQVASTHPPFGPFYNPDHATAALCLILPITTAWIVLRGPWGVNAQASIGEKADSVARGALLGLLWLALAGAAILAGGRGAVLSLLLAAILVAIAASRLRPALKIATACLVILSVVEFVSYRYHHGVLSEKNAIDSRLYMWAQALRMIRDHPIFGTGLGSFDSVSAFFQDPRFWGRVDHPHNEFLELAAGIGLPAAVAFFGALGAFWTKTFAYWRGSAPRGSERILLIGGLVSCLAFLLNGIGDFSLAIPANVFLFSCVAAWVASFNRRRVVLPRNARGVLAVLLIGASLWTARHAAAYGFVAAAGVVSESGRPRMLEAAARIEPENARHQVRLYTHWLNVARRPPYDRAAVRQALLSLDRVAELEPGSAASLRLYGHTLEWLGASDDGRELLDRAFRLYPWAQSY